MFTTPQKAAFGTMHYLVLLLALVLGGCIAPVSRDGATLKPGDGVLVLKARANMKAEMVLVPYAPSRTMEVMLAEFGKGNHATLFMNSSDKYFVFVLPAGSYMFGRLIQFPAHSDLYGSNEIKIRPGEIIYVGDLDISFSALASNDPAHNRASNKVGNVHFKVTNRELEMLQYMDANYPVFLRTLPLKTSIVSMHPVRDCGARNALCAREPAR